MSSAQAARLGPFLSRGLAGRSWDAPAVIAGFGGAVEGALAVPDELYEHVVRAPFDLAGSPVTPGRSPGAEALLAALGRAIASLDPADLPPPGERALVVGTRTAALDEVATFIQEVEAVGANLVNPGLFPVTVMNAAAGLAAIHFGIEGPNLTLNSGALSALEAVAYGADLLAAGRARLVFVGGFESLGPLAGTVYDRAAAGSAGSDSPATIAAVLALVAPDSGRTGRARVLAFASDDVAESLPGPVSDEVAAAALESARSGAGAGLWEASPIDRAGMAPESVLLDLLAAAQRAGAAGGPPLVPLVAVDGRRPAAAAVVFGSAPHAVR
jgi:Beta-ketoacyl synthase, N-terminal domain